jgi:sugar lactone lactonase YvrE
MNTPKYGFLVLVVTMSIFVQKALAQMTGLSATISGGGTTCQNGASPNVIFSATQGQVPYTFYYSINGSMMSNVATTQDSDSTVIVSAPTNVSGSFVYQLQQVMDAAGNVQMSSGSVSVSVLSKFTSGIQVSVCPGSLPYLWHGVSYNAPGNYTFDTTSSGGCDSLVTMILSLYAVTSTTTIAVDSAHLPYKWNKKNYNKAGIYTYSATGASGCDSTATLHLIVIGTPPPPDFHYSLGGPVPKGVSIGPLAPVVNPPGTTSYFLNDANYQTSLPQFQALAIDLFRNVYIFDNYNGVINKVDTGGNITVLQPLASLSSTSAIIDPQGNLFFVNIGDQTLRKLSAGSILSTVNAGLMAPGLVAIDAASNIYASDNNLNSVTRIQPNGNYSVVWTNTRIITALVADSAGDLLVADAAGLSKISPSGIKIQTYSAFAGDTITGLTLDRKGNIYVGDPHGVSRIAALDGSISSLGSGINSPVGMALDYFGNLFVCDGNNYGTSVKKVSGVTSPATGYSLSPALPGGISFDSHTGILSGTPTRELPTTSFRVVATNASSSTISIFPLTVTDVAMDSISYNSPNVYLQNKTIDTLSPVYAFSTITPLQLDTLAHTDYAFAVVVASDKQNNIYVSEHSVGEDGSGIEIFSANGTHISTIQTPQYPADAITFDAQGNLFYVSNAGDNTVTEIMVSGNIRQFSIPTPTGQYIVSLTSDPAGNLYAGEQIVSNLPLNSSNYTLWKVAAGDSVPTLFVHLAATGLASDKYGNIYVTQASGKILYRVAPDGTETALSLSHRIGYAICVNPSGNIFFMDLDQQVIRVVDTAFTNADSIYVSVGLNLSMTNNMYANSAGDIFFPDFDGNTVWRILNPKRFVVSKFTIAPALPSGLKMDSLSGTISGKPLNGSAAIQYSVTAARLVGNAQLPVSIAVNVIDTARITVCSASLPYLWKGSSYDSAGTYSKLVSGNGGPDSSSTLILSINMGPSVTPKNGAYLDSVCYGANHALALTASGGKKPYQYSANGINWQTAASFSLPAGNYNLEVEDANGCISSTPTVTVVQPQAILTIDSLKISQGSLIVDASGGFIPYAYSFDAGPFQDLDQFSLKLTGRDTVTVEDAAGCMVKKQVGIMIAMTTISGNSDSLCYGATQKILTSVTGGVKPYQYSLDGINWQTAASFSVAGGTYTVMVKDVNNNLASANTITILQPQSPLDLSLAVANQTCKTASNGSITASAVGGFGNYRYSIDKINFQSSSLFSGLTSGNYTITVRDGFGCTATQSVTLKKSTQTCSGTVMLGDTAFGEILSDALSGDLNLVISPNPTQSAFHLEVRGGGSGGVTVIIRDILGRQRQILRGQSPASFDFGGGLSSGIYLVEVLSGTRRSILKVIKIK